MSYRRRFRFYLGFIIFISICESQQWSNGESVGHEIWDFLFKSEQYRYNNEVRPVRQWSTPTSVNVSADIIAIFDFNEVKQTIALTTKLLLVWKDEYLMWKPSRFGNVTHIHLPQSKVWKPYIFLENSVSRQAEIGTPSLQVVVHHDGIVEWNPAEVFQFTCAADVRKFPFDTQTCTMVFEAIGYTSRELTINSVKDKIDFHGSSVTSGWSVMETEMDTVTEHGYDIHIMCSVTLRRNPTYFILNIFLPIVILSFMNICVFILPVQSGEKASFAITVFLSLAVFLTIVSSNLPENSDQVSILNVYVFMCTLLSVIIAILTLIQIKLYHRDEERPVSPCLLKLADMFHVSKPKFNATGSKLNVGNDINTHKTLCNTDAKSADVMVEPRFDHVEKGQTRVIITWPKVAQALDKVFMVVCLILNVIMTSVLFAMAFINEEIKEEGHGHESH